MKPFLIFTNILRFCKINNIKEILFQVGYAPYDVENKKHLIHFESIDKTLLDCIKEAYLKKNYSIIEIFKTNYLINAFSNIINIRELEQINEKLLEKEISNFIFGIKHYKVMYKCKGTLLTHKRCYQLINSIRDLNDDTILLIESEKFFISNNACNLISLYNPSLEPETFIRMIGNIEFKYLIIPDINNIELIKTIINKFFNKKIFISHSTDISFANFEETLIVLNETKSEFVNKIKFNDDIFNKTLDGFFL